MRPSVARSRSRLTADLSRVSLSVSLWLAATTAAFAQSGAAYPFPGDVPRQSTSAQRSASPGASAYRTPEAGFDAPTRQPAGAHASASETLDPDASPRRETFSRAAAKPISRRATSPADSDSSEPRGRPQIWTTFGSLILIIAVILVLARLWKKHGGSAAGLLPVEVMKVLGRRPLDQRHVIHLVRIGNRILVLGATAQDVRTLAEFTDPAEVDLLAGLCQPVSGDEGMVESFRTLFRARTAETAPNIPLSTGINLSQFSGGLDASPLPADHPSFRTGASPRA